MDTATVIYQNIVQNLANLPISFCYGNKKYQGFDKSLFDIKSLSSKLIGKRNESVIILAKDCLEIKVVLNLYEGYNALDYTVYFKNNSATNSKIIKNLYTKLNLPGNKPVLRGILGDHKNYYKPYEFDLTHKNATFRSLKGRATHIYFPYFDFESEQGGVRLAIGWGGTWEAGFKYNKNGLTEFTAGGCVGLKTYLKPSEVIRTPMMAGVWYTGGENAGVNAWRKWLVDCIMPRNSFDSAEPLQPFSTVFLAPDTGKPNSDGSISEYHGSWKASLDAIYENGLQPDFRWIDAGWYYDGNGNSIESEWHLTGSWELDREKWQGCSLKDSVAYAKAHGTKTFMWFEPERMRMLSGIIKNYGFKREWAISTVGFFFKKKADLEKGVLNLANPYARAWVRGRILSVLQENDIDMYREDFNTDIDGSWKFADRKEGFYRRGITENKYMQGHYLLWDEILADCKARGKCSFIDSCASGGGRNDLETLKRAVPVLRSDSDRTTIPLRLAMTTSLGKWLPFSGCSVKEGANQVLSGKIDIYILRASYLPAFNLLAQWHLNKSATNYPALRQGMAEWQAIKRYLLKDFYALTPYNAINDATHWTAFEYFDGEDDSGVIQAFRQAKCKSANLLIKVKGVNANRRYKLVNIDGGEKVLSGAELLAGITIHAEDARSALIIYINNFT